jgi:hypothetical protein
VGVRAKLDNMQVVGVRAKLDNMQVVTVRAQPEQVMCLRTPVPPAFARFTAKPSRRDCSHEANTRGYGTIRLVTVTTLHHIYGFTSYTVRGTQLKDWSSAWGTRTPGLCEHIAGGM